MTESYILYLETELPVQAVLETIFEPKSISPLDGTNLLYARGLVYLAHAQPLPEQIQTRHAPQFGFMPSMSIRYFPDGVSSVTKAMDMLAEAVVRWLTSNPDNLLLSANKKVDVVKRLDKTVTVNKSHLFWTVDRLKLLNMPYEVL